MTLLTHPDRISLRTDGLPSSLSWRGIRYRVTDTPTPLRDAVEHPFMTHPLTRQIGWRFQGTPERGASLVFDVLHSADGWVLARVYE